MGGILINKLSDSISGMRSDFEKVDNKVPEYLVEGDEKRNIENILSLSYDMLPYSLRDCFLYLGTFPEDYEISVWKLTRMWISEGFIKEKDATDQSKEDVAEENLKELIKRNLVMVVKKNVRGYAKMLRVHDMIRQVCKRKAEDSNRFHEVRFSASQGRYCPPVSDIKSFRRICLHSSVLEFFNEKPNCSKVRSFICFSKEDVNVPQKKLSSVIDPFMLIRVLEGSRLNFSQFAGEFKKLIHLRYITFSVPEKFSKIPHFICKLSSLETIVVTTKSKSFEINGLSCLTRLRNLKTNSTIVLTNVGTANNDKLQTLSRLSTLSVKDKVLSKTRNLKRLGICGDLDSILNSNCLEKLERLSKLKLIKDTESNKPWSRVPNSNFFPPNLTSLTLAGTRLDWSHMNTLGMLLNLKILKLKEYAFMGENWRIDGSGFHSLELLHIERSNLTLWTVSNNSFGELRYLVIKNCEKLLNIPDGLVRKLCTLEVERVSTNAMSSLNELEKKKKENPEEFHEDFKLIITPV